MPNNPLKIPRITKEKTIPLEKIKLLTNGFCSVLKPARYAIVMGRRDREHGPKLVKRPLRKVIAIVRNPGSFNPLLINSSLF